MNLQGLFTVLYTVVCVFNVCDSKLCDEYFIIFEEQSCGKTYHRIPTKIDAISWKDLTYPYNSTEVYKEIQGYKECLLEFDCKENKHETCSDKDDNKTIDQPNVENSKPNKTMSNELDSTMIDINIIYVNENDIKNSANFTEKTLDCDYAKTICINETQLDSNSLAENGITHHETPRALVITIQRDLNATIQPIFTGYFPQTQRHFNSSKDIINEMKTVSFTCELLEDTNCRKNLSNKSNKEINVYLKTNYVQNNITTKYPNCTKDFSITNDSLNFKCDAEDFAHHNQQILLPLQVSNESIIKSNNQTSQEEFLMGVKDLLICKCQIANELNNIDVHTNDVINFINCSNYINIKNKTKPGDLHIVLIEDNKDRIKDNKTITNTTEINKQELFIGNIGHHKDFFSIINEDNVITIRITENGDNCSNNSSFSVHSGKIIDLETRTSKKEILDNNNVVLNISNCINLNTSVLKNIEAQVELAIVLKNGSLNMSELFDENGTEEADAKKQKIILKCVPPYLNPDSDHGNINKTILQCKSIDLKDFPYTIAVKNTTVNNGIEEEKNNTEKYHNETNITCIDFEPDKNNCTFNETITQNKHNDTTTNVHHTEEGNDTLNKENSSIKKQETFNRKKDMPKDFGQNSLSLDSNEPEKTMIIILSAIAVTCILAIFGLKKCNKKTTYHASPTREDPDEEETPF